MVGQLGEVVGDDEVVGAAAAAAVRGRSPPGPPTASSRSRETTASGTCSWKNGSSNTGRPIGLSARDHTQRRHDEHVPRVHERQILVVHVLVVGHVDEPPDARLDEPFVVLECRGMRDDPDVLRQRLVEDRGVDVWVQLDLGTPPLVPGIDPDLENADPTGRLRAHDIAGFDGAGDRVQSPPAGIVGKPGVRSTARCPHAWRDQVASTADLAESLGLPHVEGYRLTVAPGRDDGADSVVGMPIEMVDQVVAGKAVRTPPRVALPPEMRVGVHQGRHHGLPGQVDDRGTGRPFDLARRADLENQIVAHDECRLVDDAAVADNDAPTDEHLHGVGIKRRLIECDGGRRAGPGHEGDSARERGETTHWGCCLCGLGGCEHLMPLVTGTSLGLLRDPRVGRQRATTKSAAHWCGPQ